MVLRYNVSLMIKNTPKRTLKEAINLDNMQKITSDDLLAGDMDFRQKIRHEATIRNLEHNRQYVCSQCGHGVFVAVSNKREPYWKHYRDAPQSCPWWTGDTDTVDKVSANQFQGQQESPLHNRLKYLIATLLQNDTEARDIQVEKTIVGEKGRRKPDIQAAYGDKKIAFEIQLATTQIPIIVGREKFYQSEKRFLVWLTWQFEERPLDKIQQSFLDVYYRHQRNIFSLDDETIGLSQRHKTLILRAHAYTDKKGWEQKLVSLDDLIWPDTGLPYAIPSDTHAISFGTQFREKWLNKVSPNGMKWEDQETLIGELLDEFDFELSDKIDIEDLSRLFSCLLSLERGEPIGTREVNLSAYANTFLSATSRHKYANLFEWTAKRFKRDDILAKDTVKRKLETAKRATQVKGSFEAELIKLVFNDWF